MVERIDMRQLNRISEEQYRHLNPNGQVMACMKELASLNRGY